MQHPHENHADDCISAWRRTGLGDALNFQERTLFMAACIPSSPDAPHIALALVGAGEPLIRLEKRLHCAAAGLGLALDLDIQKDAAALGIPFAQTPAVLLDGRLVLSGLPRTEEIEAWLRQAFQSGNQP